MWAGGDGSASEGARVIIRTPNDARARRASRGETVRVGRGFRRERRQSESGCENSACLRSLARPSLATIDGEGASRLLPGWTLSETGRPHAYDAIMKRAVVATAAFLLFVATGRSAYAAGAGTLEIFPAQPRVGEPATIQVRTFVLLDPSAPTPSVYEIPLAVGATLAGGRQLLVHLARQQGDPYLWSGTLRFPSRGRWTLCAFDLRTRTRAAACRGPNLPRTELQVRVRAKRARVDVWHHLERPLHIRSIAGGSGCLTASTDPKGDLSRIGFSGLAWGEGPAYPGGFSADEGKPVLRYLDPIPRRSLFSGSEWFGSKVLWMIDPVYRGPVLIRGRQLDGPNELRFDRGRLPPRVLRIPAGSRDRASFTRVRAPGCYAYQVDGLGFSYTIVFEAQPFATTPGRLPLRQVPGLAVQQR